MAEFNATFIRPHLEERRRRLVAELPRLRRPAELERLLGEVDAALARLDDGSYGLCDTCHDPIEPERLLADPLTCFCLDHLPDHQRRDLETDLALAGRIQRSLLPARHLVAGDWEVWVHSEPAGAVSGDYCDLVPSGNGHGLLFAFGDVSGKGVAAAFLAAHLRAILHSLAGEAMPVADLMERASRLFRESTLAPYFATLVCGRARPGGEVELTNAGHCPPLLLSGGEVRELEPGGLPVGTALSCCYTSQSLALPVGATLLLYTDGLSEARDRAGAEYGAERLAAVARRHAGAPLAELVGACLADVNAFLAGAAKADDLTLMALRRLA
jgi:sigma-B regulation protein RsbU (phosphoserine phosphatase)